ncbi:Ribosomal RNA small subunit methyltransferase I [Bacillus licheniformis]|nr:Ribosomal RNA small subunit methyltransferase I [Bacillus licheniformis]
MLKEADIIAAEDTRQTKKLCHVYEIETQLVSYHEHNKESSGHKILEWLKEGKNVALVSDAGMPTISDPGAEIVRDFIEMGGYVVPLPGANAALTALIASGIGPQPFFFFGFLDRQTGKEKTARGFEEQTGNDDFLRVAASAERNLGGHQRGIRQSANRIDKGTHEKIRRIYQRFDRRSTHMV